ncbi:MAG: type II toxin-antitoxin system VapC family toxin [Rhizobiaceae bacterium]|jgi:tRNA(fMet)-specific endonuclease VapC|nr:type II toxin-antitoxin system VapC family toxin [Rhizobiaceae bacterium]
MTYLLDTNILSHLVRFPTGSAAIRIAQIGSNEVFTSIVVAAEARFGAAKKGSELLTSKIENILTRLRVEPFDAPADLHYADIRHHLERSGTPISPNDMLIAAHALGLGATLVTANETEFSRVPGLKIENWLR